MTNGNTFIFCLAIFGSFGGMLFTGTIDIAIFILLFCILLSIMWHNERESNNGS